MIVRSARTSRATARAAFTLLEVLIVVAILVVLAGVGGVTYMSYLETAKEDTALAQIKNIQLAVEAYRIKHGDLPALVALTQQMPDGGASTVEPSALRDPWGKEYQYDASGQHNGGRRPDIWTVAPNGKTIGNWS